MNINFYKSFFFIYNNQKFGKYRNLLKKRKNQRAFRNNLNHLIYGS